MLYKQKIAFLKKMAGTTRESILKMTYETKSSHIGSAFSVVDIILCVYSYVFTSATNQMILSKGHAASAFYAVLSKFGKISEQSLNLYCADGGNFSGHVSHYVHEDITLSTGSLGHGLPYGAGIAIAKKNDSQDGKVFVIMSDGEMNEGTTWETALIANSFELNNLIVIVDRNYLQSLGNTESIIKLEPLDEKWKSFGWNVHTLNAHDYTQIIQCIESLIKNQKKPTCIIANSIKGFGISFMENSVKWHYKSPENDDLINGLQELKLRFT